jgi:long-chain acyl-CoA synthetase
VSEGVRRHEGWIVRSKREGSWQTRDWSEIASVAGDLAAGLIAHGIEPGDRVGLICHTREEWLFADLAILMAGATTVPIYPSTLGEDCWYVLGDSACKAVFVEDPEQLEKLRSTSGDGASTELLLMTGDAEGCVSWPALVDKGRQALAERPGLLDERRSAVSPTDLATIIYTSGTTGVPKGVMLGHDNFLATFDALDNAVCFTSDDEQLVFLPLSHILAKVFLYGSLYIGVRCSFAEGLDQMSSNLKETRPTFMAGVPRVYEKVYERVQAQVAAASPLKRSLFHWAVGAGRSYHLASDSAGLAVALQHRLADRLVLSAIRQQFGGRTRFFVSGGGSLSREVAHFFEAIGVPLLNGYGLTETTAVVTASVPDRRRVGTVGRPLPGTEVRLDDDGEVLVRGVGVTRGYLGNDAATAESTTPDGWFRTGDIGRLDDDGFLEIVDRKKEIIVTAGGKNVAPQKVENLLKAQPSVSNAMVFGDRRKYLTALLTVEEEVRRKAAERSPDDPEGVLRQWLEADVEAANAGLPSWESVKKFHLLENDFSEAGGELTPTLKLKRKVIIGKYQAELEGMYGALGET